MSKVAESKKNEKSSGPQKRAKTHKYSEIELEDVDDDTIKRVLKKAPDGK